MIIHFLFQGHHHHHHCRQVHLPLTEFAAFFRGQQVEDAPQLDLTKVTKFLFMAVIESTCFHKHNFYSQIGAFGLQTFGGVYDNFKQSGAGALEIDSISLYWAFAFNKPFCKFEWNNFVPNTLNDTPLLFTSAFKMLYNVCMFCVFCPDTFPTRLYAWRFTTWYLCPRQKTGSKCLGTDRYIINTHFEDVLYKSVSSQITIF